MVHDRRVNAITHQIREHRQEPGTDRSASAHATTHTLTQCRMPFVNTPQDRSSDVQDVVRRPGGLAWTFRTAARGARRHAGTRAPLQLGNIHAKPVQCIDRTLGKETRSYPSITTFDAASIVGALAQNPSHSDRFIREHLHPEEEALPDSPTTRYVYTRAQHQP